MRTFFAVAVLLACTMLGVMMGEKIGYDYGYSVAEQASWDQDTSDQRPSAAAYPHDVCKDHPGFVQCKVPFTR